MPCCSFILLEHWLSEQDLALGCLHEKQQHFIVLPIILITYNLVASVFLLNTLIAMMANTFQRHNENQTRTYQLSFAKMCITW